MKVSFLGILSKDPEIKQASTGTPYAKLHVFERLRSNFNETTQKWEDVSSSWNITVWASKDPTKNTLFNKISSYKKGMLLFVNGDLENILFTGQDGKTTSIPQVIARASDLVPVRRLTNQDLGIVSQTEGQVNSGYNYTPTYNQGTPTVNWTNTYGYPSTPTSGTVPGYIPSQPVQNQNLNYNSGFTPQNTPVMGTPSTPAPTPVMNMPELGVMEERVTPQSFNDFIKNDSVATPNVWNTGDYIAPNLWDVSVEDYGLPDFSHLGADVGF